LLTEWGCWFALMAIVIQLNIIFKKLNIFYKFEIKTANF